MVNLRVGVWNQILHLRCLDLLNVFLLILQNQFLLFLEPSLLHLNLVHLVLVDLVVVLLLLLVAQEQLFLIVYGAVLPMAFGLVGLLALVAVIDHDLFLLLEKVLCLVNVGWRSIDVVGTRGDVL